MAMYRSTFDPTRAIQIDNRHEVGTEEKHDV